MGKPGMLQFMGLQGVRHNLVTEQQLHIRLSWGFPGGTGVKEPTCQCRRYKGSGFSPWVGKIPWRKAWQPTPVFLPKNPMDRGA